MIKVEITSGIPDSVTRDILVEMAEEMEGALGAFRCPVHGDGSTVTIRVLRDGIAVAACCEEGQKGVDAIVDAMK